MYTQLSFFVIQHNNRIKKSIKSVVLKNTAIICFRFLLDDSPLLLDFQ